MKSPYYKKTHREFRKVVRAFVETEITPTMNEWKDNAKPPHELYKKLGKLGFL
eukprot:gene18142-5742_t